ncbi:MAG: hypothetical protein AVDCRST_MAG02-2322, partial [uncultured Rubrobacteraceae bacterium]
GAGPRGAAACTTTWWPSPSGPTRQRGPPPARRLQVQVRLRGRGHRVSRLPRPAGPAAARRAVEPRPSPCTTGSTRSL